MKPFEVLGWAATAQEVESALMGVAGLAGVGHMTPDRNKHTVHAERRSKILARHPYASALDWHQDDDGHTAFLVLWADDYPTEVKLPDGSVVRAAPGEVVLIDNALVHHRIPADYVADVEAGVERNRHFLRMYRPHVSKWGKRPPSRSDIKAWKAALSGPRDMTDHPLLHHIEDWKRRLKEQEKAA